MTTVTTARLPVEFIDTIDHHDAVDRLKLLNRGSGFVITIERTKQDKTALKQTRKVFLRCWKSRPYKSTSTGARKSSTRSTECPWRACLTRQDGGWRVEVRNPEHNHELDATTPPPTILRRQKPQAPPRALAAMTPYTVPGAVPQATTHPGGAPYAAPPFPTALQGQPYTPQPFPSFPQFPMNVSEPTIPNRGYHSTTPPGSPPRGLAYLAPNAPPPLAAQPPTAPPPASGSRRYRRRGMAIMSEIKRYQVPVQQRTVTSARNPFQPEAPAFLVYHDEFNSILGDNPDLMIAYEDNFPFAHGAGIYSPQRDIVFVTSKPMVVPGRLEKTVKINKMTRELTGTWRRDEVLTEAVLVCGGTNHGDGLLFCAQGDYRNFGGLVHIEANFPHKSHVLLNNYLGRRFNSVNDVVVHSDGSIWFTDPIYGFEEGLRPKPDLPNQVYRFDPQTGDVRVVADGFGRPKGICFSPYEKMVYISDTDSFHGDGSVDPTRSATIYAYDVLEKRNAKWLVNRRVFAMPDCGVPDGIKCDAAGNVYAGCGDGLNVWNSAGTLLGKVLIPGGITNFCFGKSGELFLLNETRFWILKVAETVKGALLVRMGLHVDPPDAEGESSDDDESMTSLFGDGA